MKSDAETLQAEMLACEEALLHADHSVSDQTIDTLLAPDFIEINAAGGETSRADVCRWLRQKDSRARWQFSELRVWVLSENCRLVSYHARQIAPQPSAGKGARHSSVWIRNTEAAPWQLHFHQTTKLV